MSKGVCIGCGTLVCKSVLKETEGYCYNCNDWNLQFQHESEDMECQCGAIVPVEEIEDNDGTCAQCFKHKCEIERKAG